MNNPQQLELPMFRINFHSPKDIRAIEILLYYETFRPACGKLYSNYQRLINAKFPRAIMQNFYQTRFYTRSLKCECTHRRMQRRGRELTFNTLWTNSAHNKLMIFFSYFPQKIGCDMSCKLSRKETSCRKCCLC